jgi:hypothetical protein
MPAITGGEIVGDAFGYLNCFLPGESIPAPDGEFARRQLNDLLSEWSQQNSAIPVIGRERFLLVAGQGGPMNPYTIGIGGDFNTERPSNQNSLVSANLILTASNPEVRVPLGIYTDQAYDANQLPDLSNSQPTGLYYNPTYQHDLGSIFLWPVPNTSVNNIELFLQKSIVQFPDLSTEMFVPEGYPKALKYALADLLQTPYGRTLSPAANRIRVASVAAMRRSNDKLSDLGNDAYVFTQGRRTTYNIRTGSGG